MKPFSSFIYFIKEAKFNPAAILHGALYGQFVSTYLHILDILLKKGPDRFRNHVTETYHAKVVKLDDASRFVSVNRDICLTGEMEHILPYKYATDIILKNPQNIVAFQCPCRNLKKNPCRPTDVCLMIGDPFADLAQMFHPLRSRRISAEEALNIIKEEDERGHVHTAWFKTAMLNRFYAICNCCKCCCTGMKSMSEYNMQRIQPSGYLAEINDSCHGCGKCTSFCQFDAIVEDISHTGLNSKGERQKRPFKVIEDKCFGCGVCESKCKQQAITMLRDPEKGIPLNIDALAAV